MNQLQGLDQAFPTFVSLNPLQDPSAQATEAVYRYEHPTLDTASVKAQRDLSRIQGVNRTWFCGACYERWGSHEDALRTGLSVARRFGADLPWVAGHA
jgi:predicted NAD/FAD-binding protein